MPPTHPLASALRQLAFPALEDLLRKMFGRADDALFELGERAQSDGERRHYFDTVRVLRLDQTRIVQRFIENLEAHYDSSPAAEAPDQFDPEELSIQPTDELEERIALTNLVARAEGLHRQLVYEVERRLDLAVRQFGLTISSAALSPPRICEAFAAGIRPLDSDFQIKLIVFKLFEREMVRELHGFYERVLALLDEHAPVLSNTARPAPASLGADSPAALARAAAAAGASGAAGTPAAPAAAGAAPAIDPRTLEVLQRQSQAAAAGGGDGALAAELVRVLQGLSGLVPAASVPAAAASTAEASASMQRLSLANQFFDRLMAEPLLPDSARPSLERLRFPVIKTALSDPGFFAAREHPLRKLLGELVDLAVGGAIGEAVAPKAFGDSVARVADQADIDAALVRDALTGLRPLDGEELDRFVSMLRDQETSRRELLLARVRRLVAQELEVQTLGREVPDPAQTLLRSGMGPLLAFRLLKHGRSSAPYREAHTLLERLLGSFERDGDEPSDEALCESIAEALAGIGMRPERVDTLLNGLREVQRAPAAPEPPPTAATESKSEVPPLDDMPEARLDLPTLNIVELLERVLQPGNWFRVYDAEHRTTRWLRLANYYAHQDSIAFSGFDEGIKLSVRAQRFAIDLADGRSEPINPDLPAQRAVETLRRARAGRRSAAEASA